MKAQSLTSLTLVVLTGAPSLTRGFSASVPATPGISVPHTTRKTDNKKSPFSLDGLNIELPDFGELFERIQEVSPLARQALAWEASAGDTTKKGLAAVDDAADVLRWKRLEKNSKGAVHQIDKIDGYNGKSAPILRFRSSLKGPLVNDASLLGTFFGRYIIDLEERKKWDAQIEQVFDIKTIDDLESINSSLGLGQYGDCSRLGIGYGQTKKALGITPREQLYLYGLQKLPDGSSLIWGADLDEGTNDHLLPGGKRHTRAKSHLFSATLVPTGDDTFDIEYVLQLSIGGNVPTWLTTPVMIDTVKNLFRVAEREFREFSKGIDSFLASLFKDNDDQLTHSLLMTP